MTKLFAVKHLNLYIYIGVLKYSMRDVTRALNYHYLDMLISLHTLRLRYNFLKQVRCTTGYAK